MPEDNKDNLEDLSLEDFEELFEEGDEEEGEEQTSREQVDEFLDEKIGKATVKKYMGDIPGGEKVADKVADKAVKEGGGKFSPINMKGNQIVKDKARDSVAKVLDTVKGKNNPQNNKPSSEAKESPKGEDSGSDLPEKKKQGGNSIADAAKDAGKGKAVDAAKNISKAAKGVTSAINTVKSLASGDKGQLKEELKSVLKQLVWLKVRKYVIIAFLVLLAVCVLIMCVFAFIENAIAVLDKPMTNYANTHEKLDNFLNGMGFQDSEEAFYDELNALEKDHDYQINIPILMATLFYDDTHDSVATMGIESTSEDDGTGAKDFVYSTIYKWFKESNETIGKDGLVYSSNKIYRMRKLVRNQFDNRLFSKSSSTTSTPKEKRLSEYTADLSERIGSDVGDILKNYISYYYTTILAKGEMAEDLTNVLFGNEVFTTTDVGAKFEAVGVDLFDILDSILSQFTDVESVGFCSLDAEGNSKDGLICVKYYENTYNEDTYFEYLRSYYIKYMPEFKKYISSETEEEQKAQIEKIIDEIKETAENYEDIFGKTTLETTENYTRCEGNIKDSLIGDLSKPVKISGSVSFSGSYGYGTAGGVNHQGVDLNSTTAGVNEGDSVYSVYGNGEVIGSTADSTYTDKNVKGGWLRIKYKYDTESYEFDIIYGGMSKDSVTLKKGDTVDKNTEIGKIGNKDESEDGDIPSLHFGFYDYKEKIFLNPTNIFVPCTGSGNTCETYMMHDVYSISETNFKSALESYCASGGCNSQINNWDYSSIYNYSVKNNLNPTFTVARAFVEGFSPGSSSNNYWGIGCSNECNSCCLSYGSLEAGVNGLATLPIVADATTMYDVFSSGYAYLGNYWMRKKCNGNDCDWASGGCIYYPSIKEFLSESRIAEVDNICSSSNTCNSVNGGAGCVATTDEDHNAYYQYQCKDTLKYVTDIFGDYIAKPSADTGQGINVGGQSNAAGMSWEEKKQLVFPNGVPESDAEMQQYLTTVTCDTTSGGLSVTVHKAIAQDVVAACSAAKAEGFEIYEIGGYRTYEDEKPGGGNGNGTIPSIGFVVSQHGYGLAVDINADDNCYSPDKVTCSIGSDWNPGVNKHSVSSNSAFYKSLISNGWGWGGEWNSSSDYMHFSFFGY